MPEMTSQQKAAVESRGKVIVSASAGSGKTFVMIEKLARAIEAGADLDGVLAVTFTKKAAAQMKDKLRRALIARVEGASGAVKARLKAQIAKIPAANISTIHSFCSRLLRTYFYALDIDGGFDIIADDDSVATDLKERALDNLFERLYEEDDGQFIHLLKRFSKKRSDGSLRALVLESYAAVRSVADYKELLERTPDLFTEEGFGRVCRDLSQILARKYKALSAAVETFRNNFPPTTNADAYDEIFCQMLSALSAAAAGGIFEPLPPLSSTRKPKDSPYDKDAGEAFKNFRQSVLKKYAAVRGDLADRETEFSAFIQSGVTACAFAKLLLQFDGEYSAVKRDENKLDYNDLEHLTLRLLKDDRIRAEINSGFEYVFVDEYQDVNPVQERIISSIGREVFLVGDVKQAIYGFRGSKSLFFAEKFNRFMGGEGTALRLSSNFRSTSAVLNFANSLFSEVMREDTCGFDYKNNSEMTAGGGYPEDCGFAGIHVYGSGEKEDARSLPVYSVSGDLRKAPHTREGLAILQIVERELQSRHFDLNKGEYVDTQPGDICILTRKNKNKYTDEIVRALRDAGYSVSGSREGNVCDLPEVKKIIDILSLIDNAEQDIPLVTAMLSPLGRFSEDELAAVRIFCKREKKLSFRRCCALFMKNGRGTLREKLEAFFGKLNTYRDWAEILTAGELIDKLLAESGLEAEYSADGGEKLKNVLRLAAEDGNLSLPAFLAKLKAGGYKVAAPSAAPSDSIKIMTMHSAKGLEFPVVILSDICRTFKGRDYSELPFDDEYGFAPKLYDPEKMITYPTVLRRLVKIRAEREELKNELNLFYVGCTRAMCNLHIIASEIKEYSPADAQDARCYAQTFDMARFSPEIMDLRGEIEKTGRDVLYFPEPDKELTEAVERRFMQVYAHEESIDLPVKSSASAILKSMKEDAPYFAENQLFSGEGETGTERGIAYHRFLELCDFSLKSREGIEKEIESFVSENRISAESAALLNAAELEEILNMPVFDGLKDARLLREQEFLCRLPACDVFPTAAQDSVLIQGAMDLLAVGEDGARIIDYKYSKKTDEQLAATYSGQLALYKRAASKILKIPEEKISAAIINIYRRRLIML